MHLGNTAPFEEKSQRWRVVGNSVFDLNPGSSASEPSTLSHRLFDQWKNCITDIIKGSPLKTYSKVRGFVQCGYFAGKKREGFLHCGHPYSLITKYDNSVTFIVRKFRDSVVFQNIFNVPYAWFMSYDIDT